jgi:hypothetical protein
MKTDDETKQILVELARAVRFISHGEKEPAGLEGLTMAISGGGTPGDNNLVDAIRDVAEALREIAEAHNNVADAIKKVRT